MSQFAGLALAVDKAGRMPLRHPVTRQPIVNRKTNEPAWIEVYSTDSEVARKLDRDLTAQRIDMRGAKLTPEQMESDRVVLLAGLTAGWKLADLDGNPIDVTFSPAAVTELYSAPGLAWVRQQVDEFAVARGNFLKAS